MSRFEENTKSFARDTRIFLICLKADVPKANAPFKLSDKTDGNYEAELMSTMSTLYAKLLVVIGIAIPVTASVSHRVPNALNQVRLIHLFPIVSI